MAVELGKFISELLGKLPENHPDRAFLQSEAERVRLYMTRGTSLVGEAQDQESAHEEVARARKEIQRLVDLDNSKYIERYGRALSDQVLEGNLDKIKRGNGAFASEYVGNLLPANCHSFGYIINLLARAHLDTKSDLIRLSDTDIIGLRNVSRRRGRFIFAMRDLAIAEKSAATQESIVENPRGFQ